MILFLYLKSLHIIFVVTWFAGLFYMPRLLIYNVEALDKTGEVRGALQAQFKLMQRRLWYGITWPSAVLTLIFGTWMFVLYGSLPNWLILKLCFVFGLYCYQFFIHHIFKQQQQGIFNYSSQQLRMINELATLFLIAIVMLVVVKNNLSVLWGLGGLAVLIVVLTVAIKLYRNSRDKRQKP